HYDRDLGPVIFVDFAADLARRVAAHAATRVLEVAAGTGIVTRRLRDLLPADARLTATDLNPPMLEVARKKFQPGEHIDFSPPTQPPCPFRTRASTPRYANLASCFFPTRKSPTARCTESLLRTAAISSVCGTRTAVILLGGSCTQS